MDFEGVPGAAEWAKVVGAFDARSFVLHNVPVIHGAAVLEALWPTFVEVDGNVVLSKAVESGTYESFRGSGHLSREALESVVNHVHLWDVFDSADVPAGFMEDMARMVSDMWIAAAERTFPKRHFRVTVASTHDDYGPTVYLCQRPRRRWLRGRSG